MAAHGTRGRRAAQAVRYRCRSDVAARRSPDRAAATDRDRPRAILGRPHHHSRRADLGAVAARSGTPVRNAEAVAGRRHQHRLHFAFHRGHPARLRHRDRVPQRQEGRGDRRIGNEQAGIDRGDDRQGPRSAGRDLHPRHHAAAADRSAGGAERQRADAGRPPARGFVRGPRRGGARHLRLHGMRAARTGADPVRQDKARPRHARGRRPPKGLPQHGRRQAFRDRLRSREPARHVVPAGAGLQEHLDQHPRSHFFPAAQAVAGAQRSPIGRSSSCGSGPRPSISSSACCRAATSRRWRWRNG